MNNIAILKIGLIFMVIISFFWLFVFSMPALLSAQTQRSASSQSKTDNKVETKLTSLRKQLEEATGSQQQIGHWLHAIACDPIT